MGTLIHTETGARCTLATRTLVGRSRGAHLHLDDDGVSAEHASIWWDGAAWKLRDLASRNGTAVGGVPVPPGEATALGPAAEIRFGTDEHTWRLESVAPPTAFAKQLPGGSIVDATAEMLTLPDDERPTLTVYRDADGRWHGETESDTRPLSDLEVLGVEGQVWQLHLPEPQRATHQRLLQPTVETLSLTFLVSQDEENVRIEGSSGKHQLDLKERAHHYLLLTLARARLADGDAAPAERGWLYQDELLQMLSEDEGWLNLAVFRARKQLAKLGVEGAAGLVERRGQTKQLRLGVSSLRVEQG